MKAIKTLLAFSAVAGLLASCNEFVSKDDVNPNQPASATLQTQLPVVEVALYASYTGNMDRVSNLWGQHLAGVAQQGQDYGNYKFTETDATNDWTTIYNAGMLGVNDVITSGGDASPYYRGIAKVAKAMFLGIATDYWGAIPNKEAGQGIANFTPKYESQEEILQEIQQLLSDAIADLEKPASANLFLPGADDFIFGGAPAKWRQAALILKARYANRLTKRNGAVASVQAAGFLDPLGELALPTDDASDGMYALFSGAANELNQWYAFEDQRSGYFRLSSTLVDSLSKYSDPRLDVYASLDDSGRISGTPLGSDDGTTSYVGARFASPNSSLPLVTVTEALFIRAEAILRTNPADAAGKAAYDKAVKASMMRYGITEADAQTYIDATDSAYTADAVAKLMYEKWVSNFTTTEVWTDWRRTGVPNLQPNPKGQNGQIPRRWPTEQRERINNPNSIVVSNIITPVWWDGGE